MKITEVPGRMIGETWQGTCPTCHQVNVLDAKRSFRPLRITLLKGDGSGERYPTFNVCKHFQQLSKPGTASDLLFQAPEESAPSQAEKKKKTAAAKPGEPNHCIKPHPHAGPCKLQHPEKCPDCKYETSDPQKLLIHGDRCPGKKKQKIYMAEVTLSSGRMGPKKLNSVTPLPVPESRKRKSKPVYHNPNSRQEDLFKFFPQNQAELSEWFEMERGGGDCESSREEIVI